MHECILAEVGSFSTKWQEPFNCKTNPKNLGLGILRVTLVRNGGQLQVVDGLK
jgi:hypothetical protein